METFMRDCRDTVPRIFGYNIEKKLGYYYEKEMDSGYHCLEYGAIVFRLRFCGKR